MSMTEKDWVLNALSESGASDTYLKTLNQSINDDSNLNDITEAIDQTKESNNVAFDSMVYLRDISRDKHAWARHFKEVVAPKLAS